MAWIAIALVVLGNVVYHLGQRAVPREANAAVATVGAYLVALIATLATIPLLARGVPLSSAWRALNYSTVLVGTGIVGVEIGFLLAYRAGWTLGSAALTANAAVAVVLLALGALLYREPISLTRLSGVGFCLVGLWLVTRK
jgi:drug/metabolite transporter (DMT)-like permease